jgi:hypothetical protein
MIQLLEPFNYSPVDLVSFKNDTLEVRQSSDSFTLFVNNYQWNNYNFKTHAEAFQVFSHYYLAKGHCICTGLGFGIRENWLLKNPNVTKITVLEKNECVIDYHKQIKSKFLNDVEVIHCDASKYTGSCDTLLVDHYEQESDDDILKDLKLLSDNINCKNMWVWSLEPIIVLNAEGTSLLDAYEQIKAQNRLYKLPDIDEQTLQLFIFMFFMHESIAFKDFTKTKRIIRYE